MKRFFLFMELIGIMVFSLIALVEDPKVTIYYEGNAQVELISPTGSRILINVYDPSLLSSPATSKDILLTTHTHSDHISWLTDNFPGESLSAKAGTIKTSDFFITSVPSSYTQVNHFKPEYGDNFIFIIDVAGLRVAHCGDMGQLALTSEQLNAIGSVDIAFTQFSNIYSNMDIGNLKGFNLIDQIKPRMIIPTHDDVETIKHAIKLWNAYYVDNPFKVGPDDLDTQTTMVFIGEKKRLMSKIAKAKPWISK